MANETVVFLKEFVRAPVLIGAVAPSSARLASVAVEPVPEHGDPVIVELGPGTGSFSGAIQRRLSGRGRHLAIELNPRLAEIVQRRYPDVEVLNEDAAKLPEILAEQGIQRADVIISGLPWAAFPTTMQQSIMDAIRKVLAPGGVFATFAYIHALKLPPAVRFRRMLDSQFDEVHTSQTVWRNLPPALVYFARTG
jgi:phosphatidylethanolamine/phosphatidyl-N-methylethanolamine N-methyltransferase